jgi:signal transduction histidine kinase
MTLSYFIEANLDGLIDEWTEYARTIHPTEACLSEKQLRNSARELLLGIAHDMREAQTPVEQHAKSLGKQPDRSSAFDEVAHRHADDRLAHGFEINALVAEYRALRASVLRRWQSTAELDDTAFQEMVRFNEAIDQMLAESVRQYAQRTERIRDLFAAVLAHDLRSPLGAILNSAHVLLEDEKLSTRSIRAAANAQRSAMRMKQLIDDLFIFTRTRLGDVLPVEPTPLDMGRICQGAVDEVRASSPHAQIEMRLTGDLTGVWDGGRVGQLLVNLLSNAVQHGQGGITVVLAGDGSTITITVCNEGPEIPADALPTLFDPLTRASPPLQQRRTPPGMGLGLYICRCIAHAHHGTIAVASSENRTVFTVKIPRFPSFRA